MTLALFSVINVIALFAAIESGGYAEIGAGYMPLKHEPEVYLYNPLGYWAIGKDFDSFGVKLDHYSGIFEREKGTGLTSITIYKRFDF